jgi:hypothetical protein
MPDGCRALRRWQRRRSVHIVEQAGISIEALGRDAAVILSIAVQYGSDLETIRGALTRDHGGGPATLISSALDALVQIEPRTGRITTIKLS